MTLQAREVEMTRAGGENRCRPPHLDPSMTNPHARLSEAGLNELDHFLRYQDELTKTPAMRAKLALEMPQAVLGMHAHWLPLRLAVYQRELANSAHPRVGRNEPCPCGSGKKFKKCCGAAADLH